MGGAPIRPPFPITSRSPKAASRMPMIPVSLSVVRFFATLPTSLRCLNGLTNVETETALPTTLETTWRWRIVRPMSPSGSDLRMREKARAVVPSASWHPAFQVSREKTSSTSRS